MLSVHFLRGFILTYIRFCLIWYKWWTSFFSNISHNQRIFILFCFIIFLSYIIYRRTLSFLIFFNYCSLCCSFMKHNYKCFSGNPIFLETQVYFLHVYYFCLPINVSWETLYFNNIQNTLNFLEFWDGFSWASIGLIK